MKLSEIAVGLYTIDVPKSILTPGATSTSRRSAVRKLGRTCQRATPGPSRTSGGPGTTTMARKRRPTRSGSRCPTLEEVTFRKLDGEAKA